MNPRRLARDALVRVEGGAYSHVLVPELLRRSDLDDRDRALVTDLVAGTLRSLRRLDHVLEPFGRRRIERLDPPVRATLRLRPYQALAGVPAHAAVSEAVAVAPARSRGYVNAVLRAVAASGPPWRSPTDIATDLSYPDWILDLLVGDLGAAEARAALAAMNEPPALTLRPNPNRTDPTTLAAELRGAGIDATLGTLVHDALIVRGAGDHARLAAIAEGRATPQDQASQAVVAYLDPAPGDRVLDVASGPGGKATGIAERLAGRGSVVATELNPGRLRLVTRAAARLGCSDFFPVLADARHPPFRSSSFDRVLVDAPCSGLGVLRRRPEARWRVELDSLETLGVFQLSLVLAAAALVRDGGTLVYSVCTLSARETTVVADAVRARLPMFHPLAPPPPPWRPTGPGAVLLPQDAGTDGMFVLGLRRDDTGGRG